MKIVRKYNSKIIINKSFAKTYIEKKRELEILEKEITDIENNLKSELLPLMNDMDKNKLVSNGISASITTGYTKYSIDAKTLKEKEPSIYNKYLKSTRVNEYLTLKISD